ncbi:hypothetical protein FRC04_011503 [Tulasnella sp. 424]|nr:hypothetical protein FRC04_011503 [Tulasnella sp. 424]
MDIPSSMIHHYDGILPEDKVFSKKENMMIVHKMQEQNPNIFTEHGCFDGRKNLYSPVRYPIGDEAQFRVNDPIRPARWQVRIKWVAIINPLSAVRYIEGKKASHEESSLMTVNACNVAVQMRPMQYGLVRPIIGNMVVNIDIASAAFYKSGSLIKLCMEYLGQSPDADPVPFLSGHHVNPRARRDLLKFMRNLHVRRTPAYGQHTWTIKDISENGADAFSVESGGVTTSLQREAYIRQETGYRLRYPTLVCVQLSKTSWAPLECCEVAPGQFYRKTLAPDQTQHMVKFNTLRPDVRLQSIRNGLQVLGYGNSTYLQDLGIIVDPNPISINGRILPAPTLIYGQYVTLQPFNGRWNMKNKVLYKTAKISGCAVINYDRRFGPAQEAHLKVSLFNVTQMLGIQGMPPDPPVLRKDATGTAYWNHIKEVGMLHKLVKGTLPNLIIVVLPDLGEDIYIRIKNAGDIKIGVATQCLRAAKCGKGNEQYFANVCLKINAKLGGINVIPQPRTVRFLAAIPTIVIGAEVEYQGLRSKTRPSYSAVVGSVDSDASKYVAISRAQPCRREMIDDLADMIAHVIKKYMQYGKEVERRANLAPQRILLYRGRLPEGLFQECKNFEVVQILKAKDHHLRFFPSPGGKSDKSGNVPAGLVVDRGITSPVDSQGTSRSAHYSVLVDQNNFMPDDLQTISFALCHISARSTCSISIVPPLLYANIVTAKAKHHYDPDGAFIVPESDSEPQTASPSAADELEPFRHAFQPVHPNSGQVMYFV